MENYNSESSRRDFLKTFGSALAGLSFIGFVAPVINSCSSPTDPGADVAAFDITVDVSSLTTDNSALRTQTPDGHTLLVVRNSSTKYTTLLLVCTHELCGGSSITASGGTISCSCHGAKFDYTGAPKSGPASSNLKTYSTTYDASTKKVNIKS